MREISRLKVEELIKSAGGHFFGATFVKKDKSIRKMHGRLGVKKYLVGGENKVVKPSNTYITVWDKQAGGYRTLNLATVQSLKIEGETYKVVD